MTPPLLAKISLPCGLAAVLALSSCAQHEFTAPAGARHSAQHVTRALRKDIDTIVVIYAENRAFDNLYGNFPGARGLSEVVDRDGNPLPAYHPQLDRDGKVLPVLPPTWGGVTAAGVTPVPLIPTILLLDVLRAVVASNLPMRSSVLAMVPVQPV